MAETFWALHKAEQMYVTLAAARFLTLPKAGRRDCIPAKTIFPDQRVGCPSDFSHG